jgi:hypothetical protein
VWRKKTLKNKLKNKKNEQKKGINSPSVKNKKKNSKNVKIK